MDNQPYGTWREKLPALAFPDEHPFHHSLIGSMEDLDRGEPRRHRAVLRDVLHARQRGAVDRRRLRARRSARLVEKHFGADPARRGQAAAARHVAAAGVRAVEARSRAGRRDAAAPVPRVSLAGVRHATSTTRRASPARCSACATAAGCTAASCASDRSRRKPRRSRSISRRARDLLVVDVTARPNISPEQLEQEVAYEIDAVVRDGVTTTKSQRAVALIQTMFVSSMQ